MTHSIQVELTRTVRTKSFLNYLLGAVQNARVPQSWEPLVNERFDVVHCRTEQSYSTLGEGHHYGNDVDGTR